MEAWMSLWKWLLLLGLAGFAVMSLYVAVLGMRDIREMFRSLREEDAD